VLEPSWCEITPPLSGLTEGSRDACKNKIVKKTYFGDWKCISLTILNLVAIIWTRAWARRFHLVALPVVLFRSLGSRRAT
jgi:hypothetical protein